MMIEIVIDNDVLIKAARYGVVEALDHIDCGSECVNESGILGAARYVVSKRLEGLVARGHVDADRALAWTKALPKFREVEPTAEELELSARLEDAAVIRGLELDSGESQLVAIVIMRGEGVLLTGDKRAVSAVEKLIGVISELRLITGRVASFEQAIWRISGQLDVLELRRGICNDRAADTAVYVCFRCTDPTIGTGFMPDGLKSYIDDQRAAAPTVLFPGNCLTMVSP